MIISKKMYIKNKLKGGAKNPVSNYIDKKTGKKKLPKKDFRHHQFILFYVDKHGVIKTLFKEDYNPLNKGNNYLKLLEGGKSRKNKLKKRRKTRKKKY